MSSIELRGRQPNEVFVKHQIDLHALVGNYGLNSCKRSTALMQALLTAFHQSGLGLLYSWPRLTGDWLLFTVFLANAAMKHPPCDNDFTDSGLYVIFAITVSDDRDKGWTNEFCWTIFSRQLSWLRAEQTGHLRCSPGRT